MMGRAEAGRWIAPPLASVLLALGGCRSAPEVTPEPAKVEPAEVEPAEVEPAEGEPAEVEPAVAEPAKPSPFDLSHVRFAGGDGSSLAQAVVILGARDSRDGIAAELAWIASHYPGAERIHQVLMSGGERQYDGITIRTAGGEKRALLFDITHFFHRNRGPR